MITRQNSEGVWGVIRMCWGVTGCSGGEPAKDPIRNQDKMMRLTRTVKLAGQFSLNVPCMGGQRGSRGVVGRSVGHSELRYPMGGLVAQSPRLLDRVREELRNRHRCPRMRQAYVAN